MTYFKKCSGKAVQGCLLKTDFAFTDQRKQNVYNSQLSGLLSPRMVLQIKMKKQIILG